MQRPDARDHNAAELTDQQVADLLHASMTEIAIRAGAETLEQVVEHVRQVLGEDSIDRLRKERDMMVFAAAVMADIAALPTTDAETASAHGWGTYL